MELTDKEINIINRIGELIVNGELQTEAQVKIIELVNQFLDLKTIANYARENKMSYNGVKNFRRLISINNVKFVVSEN